jgi:hypothetical protein
VLCPLCLVAACNWCLCQHLWPHCSSHSGPSAPALASSERCAAQLNLPNCAARLLPQVLSKKGRWTYKDRQKK